MNLKKQHFNESIVFIGLMCLMGCYILTVMTFVDAYAHPTKSVTIYIDNHGEAFFEVFIMLPIIGFFAFWAIYISIIRLGKTNKEKALARQSSSDEADATCCISSNIPSINYEDYII